MATARNGWTLVGRNVAVSRKRRRGVAAPKEEDLPPEFLQSDAVRIDRVYDAVPTAVAAGRRATPPDLVVEVELAPGESSVLAIRHPSGALTFHASTERVARSTRRGSTSSAAPAVAVFRVPVRRMDVTSGRRGVISKALKVIVVKVAKAAIDKAVSIALPILAARWEKRAWAKKRDP